MAAFDCHASAAERNATLGPLQIDYLHLHHCQLAGVPVVSYAVLLIWLCLLFYFLATTADGYFSPTLASISEKLHVPYDVAGVTVLAFGNGAPDVFSAIAAYSSGVGEAGINELLGGSMFVSNVVVGFVAITSTVSVQQWAFSRDLFALVASVLLLVLIASLAVKNSAWAFLFLGVYAIYVSSAVAPACITRFRRKSHPSGTADGEASQDDAHAAFWLVLSPIGERTSQRLPVSSAVTSPTPLSSFDVELESPPIKTPTFSGGMVEDHFERSIDESSLTSQSCSEDEKGCDASEDKRTPKELVDTPAQFSNGRRMIESAYWRHLRWRWRLKRRIVQIYGGSDSIIVKVLSLPNMLLIFMRDITVPLLDSDTWSRSLAAVSWITVPQLILWAAGDVSTEVGTSGVPLWLLLLVAGIVAALVVLYTTHRSRPPDSLAYCAVFLLLAFVSCVCWVYTVAKELVAVLVAFGVITHVSNSLLGLTVLSWGNSVGDLITNVSVARAGFPEMAIAGCYGGPVFNILLGLGIPMMLAYVRGEEQRLGFDSHAWVSVGFLLFTLVLSFWVFRFYKYQCPRWYGKLLLVFYAVYTASNIAVAVKERDV